MNIILKAAALAAHYHRDQKRDSNGKPYCTHLCRVAGRVATHKGTTEQDVAGSFLHDIIEDQAKTLELHDEIMAAILRDCGPDVLNIVIDMTNPSKGSKLPRADRKQMDRAHMRVCPKNVKIIKLIDRIDNLNEFANDTLLGLERRPDFLLKYCDESEMMLQEALHGADPELELELAEAIKTLRSICEQQKTNGNRHEQALA